MYHVDYKKHKQLRRQMIYDNAIFNEPIPEIFYVRGVYINRVGLDDGGIRVTVLFESNEIFEWVAYDHKSLLNFVKRVNGRIIEAYDDGEMSKEDTKYFREPIKRYDRK